MTRNDDAGWWRKTGLTCNRDGCGADMIKYTLTDVRECTNGHRSQSNICDDCGEEIMETHLGDFCGCDN